MKGKPHPAEFKQKVLEYAADHTGHETGAKFNLHPTQVNRWKRENGLGRKAKAKVVEPQQRFSKEIVMLAKRLNRLAVEELSGALDRPVSDRALYAMLLTREILK